MPPGGGDARSLWTPGAVPCKCTRSKGACASKSIRAVELEPQSSRGGAIGGGGSVVVSAALDRTLSQLSEQQAALAAEVARLHHKMDQVLSKLHG
mmetsp:Transcript_48556/g.126895  ORF Transcript_48556/g.126895 Transcript_48556/m.126895 type:complete len:95 (+) Transcript_48556:268-552(+)